MTTSRRLNLVGTASASLLSLLTLSDAAQSQQIGSTTIVQNNVSRLKGTQQNTLLAGEAVSRDDAVQTGADSLAKIVFLDQTNLSIGPNARVSLNQYVYSEDRPAGKVALNLLKGTYRFVTGNLEKKAYEINTPVATIGVRGTIFDVSTTSTRSVVTLQEGAVSVCTRRASPQVCVTLDASGSTAVVTASGATIVPGKSNTKFSFSGYCGANPSLCTPTRLAQDSASSPANAVASLCGR